jgi:hypothetical protein
VLRRRLAILVLLYVAVDFSSPTVSGVFQFNYDDSLECARTEAGLYTSSKPAAVASGAQPRLDRVAVEVVHVRPPVRVAWRAPTTRAHLRPASVPRSPSDDH